MQPKFVGRKNLSRNKGPCDLSPCELVEWDWQAKGRVFEMKSVRSKVPKISGECTIILHA